VKRGKPIPVDLWKYFYCPDCGKLLEPKKTRFTCKIHGSWQIAFETDEHRKTTNLRVAKVK